MDLYSSGICLCLELSKVNTWPGNLSPVWVMLISSLDTQLKLFSTSFIKYRVVENLWKLQYSFDTQFSLFALWKNTLHLLSTDSYPSGSPFRLVSRLVYKCWSTFNVDKDNWIYCTTLILLELWQIIMNLAGNKIVNDRVFIWNLKSNQKSTHQFFFCQRFLSHSIIIQTHNTCVYVYLSLSSPGSSSDFSSSSQAVNTIRKTQKDY